MPKADRTAGEAIPRYRLPKPLPQRAAGGAGAGHSGKANARQSYVDLLGIEDTSLAVELERGFPFTALEHLMRHAGLSQAQLGGIANIPTTTMARRRRAGRLTPEESDRLLRIARVVADAVGLFEGDEGPARRWLDTPAAALAGRTPFDNLATEHGARLVEDLIGRLEHGTFT